MLDWTPPLTPPCTPNPGRCEAAGQLLILAAQLGKASVLKPLLSFGASLEAVDEHGHQGPALLHAASAGNVNIVRALLEASGGSGVLVLTVLFPHCRRVGCCGTGTCCVLVSEMSRLAQLLFRATASPPLPCLPLAHPCSWPLFCPFCPLAGRRIARPAGCAGTERAYCGSAG